MRFKLSKFILPSVVSMILVGTYTNVDGLFIGNVCGDNGIAAINIAWPIVALITSIGTGIGVGGSVMLNTLRGKGDTDGAARVKTTLLLLLAVAGIVSTLVLLLLYKPLLVLMGAQGQVLDYAENYSKIVCIGAFFQIAGSGLIALLRNEEKTYFSMLCCLVGLAVHVLLDILLVQKHTLGGVAVSTVLSQAVIMVMCLFALGKKNFGRADKKYAWEILKASTSPLGINFVPSLVLFFTNLFALKIGAEAAVSAYGVMSYAVYTFEYFYQGVVDGVQPVLSYCQGTGDGENKKRALKTSLIVLGVSTAVFMLLTPLMIWGMPKIFSVSAQAADLMKTGFIVYAFAYPFKAVVKFICAYYYAVGETKISNLLIYADPIFFTPITLLVLSGLGMTGVWLSLTISQLCIAALGVLSLVKKNKKQIKEPTE